MGEAEAFHTDGKFQEASAVAAAKSAVVLEAGHIYISSELRVAPGGNLRVKAQPERLPGGSV